MHEFSICQSLVAAVLEELKKHTNGHVRLTKARVAAGQYHRLVPASLKLAYKILSKGTPAEGSSLLIKTIPVKLKCNQCGWKGSTRAICFVCRKCGGVDMDVIAGKELFLESIEVESTPVQKFKVHRSKGRTASPAEKTAGHGCPALPVAPPRFPGRRSLAGPSPWPSSGRPARAQAGRLIGWA